VMRILHWYLLIQTFFTADIRVWPSPQDDKLYLIFLPIIVIKVHIKFIYIILTFIVIFAFVVSKKQEPSGNYAGVVTGCVEGGPLLTFMLTVFHVFPAWKFIL